MTRKIQLTMDLTYDVYIQVLNTSKFKPSVESIKQLANRQLIIRVGVSGSLCDMALTYSHLLGVHGSILYFPTAHTTGNFSHFF